MHYITMHEDKRGVDGKLYKKGETYWVTTATAKLLMKMRFDPCTHKFYMGARKATANEVFAYIDKKGESI